MQKAIKLLVSNSYESLEDLREWLLTDQEREQFDSFIKNNDDAGLIKWLKET